MRMCFCSHCAGCASRYKVLHPLLACSSFFSQLVLMYLVLGRMDFGGVNKRLYCLIALCNACLSTKGEEEKGATD